MNDEYDYDDVEFNRASDYVVRMSVAGFIDQFKRLLMKVRGHTNVSNLDKESKLEIRRASDDLEKKISKLVKETLKLVESGHYRK
jgi:hypothetical protein